MRSTRTRLMQRAYAACLAITLVAVTGCDKEVAAQRGSTMGRVFGTRESGGWILFFDEADALFGKRTEIQDAHDKYDDE